MDGEAVNHQIADTIRVEPTWGCLAEVEIGSAAGGNVRTRPLTLLRGPHAHLGDAGRATSAGEFYIRISAAIYIKRVALEGKTHCDRYVY